MWIDSHCHLDAAEFDAGRSAMRIAAKQAGVELCVIPSVERANFSAVQALAHQHDDLYTLGIHPLYVPRASLADLNFLDGELTRLQNDPLLVAVGEIGLDYFVPSLCTPFMRKQQWRFYIAQLALAKRHHLPVILHVRKSADMLLKGLRSHAWDADIGGIAHAFNGSLQQAHGFIDFGFKLGFGGTLTYERALNIRRLAQALPLASIVLETDAPDIPPRWLYTPVGERLQGKIAQKNTPIELPRIGAVLAHLRGVDAKLIAHQTTQNVKTLFARRFTFNQPAPQNLTHH